ncbi:MAG TPA: mechanosensitive ion channel domain-containing protein [Parafilimonas sp.]|nr:mechanosensitive ion channel domain-containing protein [Parafilimonas sp.]
MQNFWEQVWWNNSLRMYGIVLAEIAGVWIIFKLFRKFIIGTLKKVAGRTASEVDDAIVVAADKFIIPYLYLVINYAIIDQLTFSPHAENVLKVVVAVITAYYFVRFINHTIHLSVLLYMQKKEEPPERIKQLNGVLLMIKVLIWIGGFLMLIENLGYNITTIITGLGIGGIAIALAAQNILGDLFSYFVIFFDKPFEIGDTISVNNNTGTVERIGIKTSHVRSVSGEQLIIPNADLVKSTIKNIKRLERRGIIFKLNVRYDTPEEKLRSLPDLIRSIINKHEHATLERCHLVAFGDFSLTYETLYFIDTPDMITYLNIQQDIYLEIMNAFSKQGIDFAFPGQTFVLQHPGPPPIPVSPKGQ